MDVPIADVLRNVRRRYQEVDQETNRGLPRLEISCEKGCAACCYQMTLVTFVEALTIADFVIRNRSEAEVTGLIEALDAHAKQFRPHREAYFLDAKPCPFLRVTDGKWTGECSVYNVRPLCCRMHFVVSDPALCAPDHVNECTMVDTRDARLEVTSLIGGGNTLLLSHGPLSPLVAEALRALRERRAPSLIELEKWKRRMSSVNTNSVYRMDSESRSENI